jgi:hydroxypyruvate isomerase
VLINTAAGDSVGLAAVPGKSVDFLKTVKEAIKYAKAVKCPMIHLMAGKIPEGATKDACRTQLVDNLKIASDLLKDYGMVGTLEPINSKSLPGYFYSTPEEAFSILEEVKAENLYYQCDLFHLETEKGECSKNLSFKLQIRQHTGKCEKSL